MKYARTTKNWKSVHKSLKEVLGNKKWEPSVYIGKTGFISEISFIKKNEEGGISGFSYMCDQCSQPLLKRISSLIPKKFVERV